MIIIKQWITNYGEIIESFEDESVKAGDKRVKEINFAVCYVCKQPLRFQDLSQYEISCIDTMDKEKLKVCGECARSKSVSYFKKHFYQKPKSEIIECLCHCREYIMTDVKAFDKDGKLTTCTVRMVRE